MTQIDPQKERRRLAKLYGAMEDGELEKIAADFSSLTEIAKSALRTEMSTRGLTLPIEIAANQVKEVVEVEALKPVVVRRFRDLSEASIAKSVLDSAGIDCCLADDNMVRLDWFLSNLVGGIKLLVRKGDAEAATELLDENRPEKFAVDGIGEYVQPRCPQCGSMDVSLEGLNKPVTFGAMFLTRLPIPVTRKGWRCDSCRHQWNKHDDASAIGSAPESPPE